MSVAELLANGFTAACIVLAGRNNVHTWWTGLVGCVLFGWVFYQAQLYADMTLQLFFVVTGFIGWWNWKPGPEELRVGRSRPAVLVAGTLIGLSVTAGYAWLLHHFTDAYAPVPDSAVLAFSVLGQLLLMGRRVESWWCWLLVNTVSVPLYFSRGLTLTALLYVVYWVNAVVSLRHWSKLERRGRGASVASAPLADQNHAGAGN